MHDYNNMGQDGPSRGRRPAAATVTTINGNKFVSGLLWQSLTRPRSFMKEAKEIGKKEGLDIVAIRDTPEVKQAGFVSKADGVNKGMYSLAAALAGQLGDTWIGAFKLPDGQYAMVAVDRGAIIPGTDKIGDFSTIKTKLLQVFALDATDFKDSLYSPPEFAFGNEDLDIEELLRPANLKKAYTLKPLTFGLTKKEWIGIGVGAAVGIAGLIAFVQWQNAVEEAERRAAILAAQIEAQRLEELNAKTRAEQQAPALKHPWATMVGIGDFVSACIEATNTKPLSIGGWAAMSASCRHGLFAISYERTGYSTVRQLINGAQPLFENAPAFTDGGDKASLNESLAMTLAGDEDLHSLDDVMAAFSSHLQQVGIKPKVTEVPYSPPPAPATLPGADPAAQPPAPPMPHWLEFTFTFETDIPPQILFQGMPSRGIRLTDIETIRSDSAQLTWIVKGAIYANK